MKKHAALFKQWTDLTGPQQWSIGATLLGSFATITSYIVFGVPLTFYTVVVTTTIVILSDRIARYANENKTSDVMERISLSDNDLLYIGSTHEAYTWISKHTLGLRSVDNFVYRRLVQHHIHKEPYLDNYVENIIKPIIESGCIWRDLVRFRSDEQQIHQFVDTLSTKAKHHYSCGFLLFEKPLLQVMIFRYDHRITDQKNTVLFGWAFGGETESRIFAASSEIALDYFQSYYNAIYSFTNPLYVSGLRQSNDVIPAEPTGEMGHAVVGLNNP